MALEINSQNFETLIADSKPVVVDFGATWCGPCQMVAPIIEELAHEYDGRVVIGKCDVDQDSDLPGRFNVRNIPPSSSSRMVRSSLSSSALRARMS